MVYLLKKMVSEVLVALECAQPSGGTGRCFIPGALVLAVARDVPCRRRAALPMGKVAGRA
ncbi:hypothetical protein BN2497_11957 [Janthinobacterium sp. CG23_2]|nr:hypothetical protein BN2497_11957 [Janthinobacterium sp. CG23_2]CUU32376.1 hypothetical protein BN3177_11957 [Janthinobacterium sp. CG23_2]